MCFDVEACLIAEILSVLNERSYRSTQSYCDSENMCCPYRSTPYYRCAGWRLHAPRRRAKSGGKFIRGGKSSILACSIRYALDVGEKWLPPDYIRLSARLFC